MTTPQKRKGSDFERAVVDVLRRHGHPYAERAYGAGRQDDRGDITGIPGYVLECKNCKTIDLAGWTDEAVREAQNEFYEELVPGIAGAMGRVIYRHPIPIVVAKRRLKPVETAYVIQRLVDWAEMVAE